MAYFIPCNTTYDATQVTNLCFTEMVRFHEIPKSMVSDRCSKFMSHFFLMLWKWMGTHIKFSISYHLQMNDQIEVTNRTLGPCKGSLRIKTPYTEFAFIGDQLRPRVNLPFKFSVATIHPPLVLTPIPTLIKFSREAKKR